VTRIAAVNVDIDGLHLYYRIHGLAEPDLARTRTIYEIGVTRFLELFARHGIRATFFAVGEDLSNPVNRGIARRIVAEGHELASHSHTHPYDLTRLGRAGIEAELERAERAIEPIRGSRPAGFRAPGYNTSPELLGAVAERGYSYDSSLFPCPPYLVARAAVIGAYRLLGRRSQSLVGDPLAMFRSRLPHWTRPTGGSARLLELPITVLPGLRFPLIGTSLIAMGRTGWSLLRPVVGALDFVNVEFHAIDMTDHDFDGIDSALRRQPDQRVPLADKEAVFDAALSHLAQGWENRTLEEIAANPADVLPRWAG
jgi:hypothetical protein